MAGPYMHNIYRECQGIRSPFCSLSLVFRLSEWSYAIPQKSAAHGSYDQNISLRSNDTEEVPCFFTWASSLKNLPFLSAQFDI
jgi:hypothetical protein